MKKVWIQNLWIVLLATCTLLVSCKKDKEVDADPVIGSWSLKAISNGQQSEDVTKIPCLSTSTLIVDASKMRMTLSAPNQDGSCQQESQEMGWVKTDGAYYWVDGSGSQQKADITFSDNNQTLQMRLTVNNQAAYFIFNK